VQCGTDACGQSCQTGSAMTGTDIVSACVTTALAGFVGGQLAKAQDVSRTMLRDSVVLAQWENDSSSVTLLRDTFL
jgi:hypothetical protein